MKNLKKVAIIVSGILLSACGTSKLTQKDNLKVHSITNEQSDTNTVKTTETKMYGDTLKGNSFIPFTAIGDTSDNEIPANALPFHLPDTTYTITGESGGIKFKETLKPTYSNGKLTGVKADYTAIAKPKATTKTREVKLTNDRKETKIDSTKKSQSTKDTKVGFSMPSWIWLIIIAVATILFLIYVKPLFTFIKTWTKTLLKL